MPARSLLLRSLLAAVAALALLAPAALASPYTSVYHEYFSTGTIDLCKHSEAYLRAAQSEAPPHIGHTAPAFWQALRSAIAERPTTHCSAGSAVPVVPLASAHPHTTAPAKPSTPVPTTPTPVTSVSGPTGPSAATGATAATQPATVVPPVTTTPAAPATIATTPATPHSSATHLRPPLLALAIAIVLVALAALWWLLLAMRGAAPHWLVASRYALAEGRYRASATFAEFGDWLRLGR